MNLTAESTETTLASSDVWSPDAEGDADAVGVAALGLGVAEGVASALPKPTGARCAAGALGVAAADGEVTPGAAPDAAEPEPQGAEESHATMRKRSCAWRCTVSTSSWLFLPGISTTIRLLPWVVTLASATPEPLTRWSMMPRASSRFSLLGLPSAISVIRVPPCRSSPSSGFQLPPRATRP